MLNKKVKIIISLLCFVAVIAAAVGTIVYVDKNTQKPSEEKALSQQQRKVLMQNFTATEFGKKKTPKRVIDNKHPLNLLNYYGNEPVLDLWASIPENQKPFTVLLIIPGHTLRPGDDGSLQMLIDTAQICEENKIPYAIQNVNGEIAPEERLPIAYLENEFAKKHEYFYGLNAAELYNSISWRGEVESNNSQYIIDCINLCAKYGAFFFWTDTNMNYDSGMIMEWFEKNEAFYSAFKENSQYICLLNKESFGKPSTYACMQGLWLAGLVGNWGVASDWWHWQVDGDKKSLFGEYDELVDNEWDMIINYPENMYVQSMMLVMSAGGTCFKAEAPNFSTSCGGKRVGGFEYGISPLLDRIISGEISIPSKEEVMADTPLAVMGMENYPDLNYDFGESNLYPAMGDYGIIPLIPSNLRNDEIEVFNNAGITLIDEKKNKSFYDKYYKHSESDTYLKRMSDQWYFINNVENERVTKSAAFEPVLSSAQQVGITAGEHTSAIIKEKTDGLNFYISNYRTNKKEMVEAVDNEYMQNHSWVDFAREFLVIDDSGNPIGVDDTEKRTTFITVKGTLNGGKPQVVLNNTSDGKGYQNRPFTVEESWNADTHELKLVINHNGIVDFSVKLDSSAKTLDTSRLVEPEIFTRKKTDASCESLKELVDSINVSGGHNYNYYSYLKFNSALEKAKVIISENTYSSREISSAEKELKDAYENLLDISKYSQLLGKVDSENMDSETQVKFDALLRESISSLPYVPGRTNSLSYKRLYMNKDFSKAQKYESLEEKYEELTSES